MSYDKKEFFEKLESLIGQYNDFVPEDEDDKFFGFTWDLMDEATQIFELENERTSVPNEFWIELYEKLKEDFHVDPKELFDKYADKSMAEASKIIADTLTEYMEYARTGEQSENEFEFRPDDGVFGSNINTIEIVFPTLSSRTYFYLAPDGERMFSICPKEICSIMKEFLPKYSHHLIQELERIDAEGVFDNMFENGSIQIKFRNSGDPIFIHKDEGADDQIMSRVEALETTDDIDGQAEEFIELFPLLLNDDLLNEDRVYGLLHKFMYECTDRAVQIDIDQMMFDFEDGVPRLLYEHAKSQIDSLQFDRALNSAKEALDEGYEDAKTLIKQIKNDMKISEKLMAASTGEKSVGQMPFDMRTARTRWESSSFEKAFEPEDLEKTTENVELTANPEGVITIKFIKENEAGYSEALDFVNNLLEKGYSPLSGGICDGYELAVKFVDKLQFIPEIKDQVVMENISYPRTYTHAFFARAVTFPELRDKVQAYAERALLKFSNYLDLTDEYGTVPGTFAVAALSLTDKKYFPIVNAYADAVDDEHTYFHPCLVAALLLRYGDDPDLAEPIVAIARNGNGGEPFDLPDELIWNPKFLAKLMETGGASEEDTAALESLGISLETIYGYYGTDNLKKIKSLFNESSKAGEKGDTESVWNAQTYADFYNMYLSALNIWEAEEFEKTKKISYKPPASVAAAATSATASTTSTGSETKVTSSTDSETGSKSDSKSASKSEATSSTDSKTKVPSSTDPGGKTSGEQNGGLEYQECVMSKKEAKKRGLNEPNFKIEKQMSFVFPVLFDNLESLTYTKDQIRRIGTENTKYEDERVCTILLWWGKFTAGYGQWVVNSNDFKCETGLMIYDGKKKSKPMVLFGEMDMLKLGAACQKRWPKTPEDARKYMDSAWIKESPERKVDEQWLEAEKFMDDDGPIASFFVDWNHIIAKRALENITKDDGALVYFNARMMLMYIAARRGDAPTYAKLAEELMSLQPEKADYWKEKLDVAKALI